jgi:CubicO group peptidase (beta-lactamase class C family)
MRCLKLLLMALIFFVSACGRDTEPVGPTSVPDLGTISPVATEIQPAFSELWPTAGWQNAEPAEHGLDASVLAEMSDYLRSSVSSARSVLIVRDGYLVYEDNIKGEGAAQVWSVTKSILSAVIGIALDEGILGGLDDPVMDYLAAFRTEEIDPRFDEITLRHLLTMTAGFAEDSAGAGSVPAALRLELEHAPGEVSNYNSTSTHLLSAAFQEASGISAAEFAQERLFDPLGIEKPMWSADGHGVSMGGWGLQLTPRDMAKFGYLYLNEGQWDGEQIVPAEWIDQSTNPHADAGVSELEVFADYGYLWWIHSFGEYKAYSAFGYGGQMITVVPELDMVVVSTADPSETMIPSSTVSQYVLRAIVDP